MRFVTNTFLRGLAVILPVGLTLYVLWWIGTTGEREIGALLEWLFDVDDLPTGTGMMLAFALVLAIGLLTRAWIVRRTIELGERLLQKMPLVKTIYGPIKDMFSLFAQDDDRKLGKVVMVKLGDTELEMLGFVTSESAQRITRSESDREKIGVYLPMSYQLGGFLVVVPKTAVRPLELSGEEGLRLAITAGVTSEKN